MQTVKSGYLAAILIILILTACSAGSQPGSTTAATVQATLPMAGNELPATSTVSAVDNWVVYQSTDYGITFEYPAAYDDPAYKDSCGPKENNDGIQLGHQINLQVIEADDLSLSDYADNLIKRKGWTSESLNNSLIDGREAVTVNYRFGGTSRFGTFTLIEKEPQVFALNFSAGSFCDIPEKQIFEPEVYAHILETFHFIP